ncbi:hypothetical protein EAX61_16050 [Dokdonia sinensis]|uniref:Letm1 RBD domain-containing protein n=1 Tax=Dokdonia sinensis TaxID=2479847 RepID=A0A3M0FTW2_9FLAO|nr:LETM1-related biofilm-associated protein [Dokdonia sinensis]RMB56091.1 hypothetical protein EAX61_16050 [Dokdonia sinensis]
MNPSASGWIKKHLKSFHSGIATFENGMDDMYGSLRARGFVYGASVSTSFKEEANLLKWTEEERTKVNLFDALAFAYYDTIDNASDEDCIKTIVQFYAFINKKQSAFHIQLGKESPYEQLEKLLQKRIQTNEPLFKKNFSHLITNALLFTDVLAFDHFLLTDNNPINYARELEAVITNTIWLALKKKEEKEKYDDLLIKLFESSIHYNSKIAHKATSLDEINFKQFDYEITRRYILDLAALAVWDDNQLDKAEYTFIQDLGKVLALPEDVIAASTMFVHQFITKNKGKITYLNYSNPVKHFYTQTSGTVTKLILRNKNRLITEIIQSKDLVVLLGQSTRRDLNKKEKQIVKEQLLDICKSVPSLAIFILPGGGILLPLLTKFIPQLLPSAFNENRIDKEE